MADKKPDAYAYGPYDNQDGQRIDASIIEGLRKNGETEVTQLLIDLLTATELGNLTEAEKIKKFNEFSKIADGIANSAIEDYNHIADRQKLTKIEKIKTKPIKNKREKKK